jgi:ATP-binding cassette, subfamily B, bacterial
MDKSKNKLSCIESVRLTRRALKTYYAASSVHVIVYIAIMAWEALTPYVGIYLSACLIDELTNERNPEKLKALVLITLTSAAVIGIVSAILYKIRRIYNDHVTWDNLEHIYAKKMLDMDFGKFDDTKTAEQRSLIRQYQSMGFGISTSLIIYGGICKAVLTAIGGIGLTISLFTCRVSNTSGAYALLDNPVVVLLVIISLVLITYISPVLLNKADKYLVRDDLRVGNNKLLFWGFLGGKSDVAMDVRTYRLDKMRFTARYVDPVFAVISVKVCLKSLRHFL